MLHVDSDDPEYVRQMMRPVEVKEDVRQMEERKRVKLVLHSRAFRDELEELVIEQLSTGSIHAAGSLSIQQLSDIMQPRVQSSTVGRGKGQIICVFKGPILALKIGISLRFQLH